MAAVKVPWAFKPSSPWATPTPIQEECAKELNEDMVVSTLSGIVSLPCGSGKTRIAIEQALQHVQVLFLSYEMAGVEQIVSALKEHTTVDPFIINTFTGSSKHQPSGIACFLSTHYNMLTGECAKSPESKDILRWIRNNRWDLVICDECHHCPSEHTKQAIEAIKKNATRVLGITATVVRKLSRAAEKELLTSPSCTADTRLMMENEFEFIGPVLFSKRWKEMEVTAAIAKLNFVECKTPMDQRTTLAHQLSSKITRAYLGNLPPSKLAAIWNITRFHMSQNETGIIFCDHCWQAEEVSRMLGDHWKVMRGAVDEDVRVLGIDRTSEPSTTVEERMEIRNLLNADDAGVSGIIATKVADAALDIHSRRFCYGISVDASSSESVNAQRAGRVMRNNPGWLEQKEAWFYDLITPGTADDTASMERRRFVVAEGYSYISTDHLDFQNATRALLPTSAEDRLQRPWLTPSTYDADHPDHDDAALSLLVRALRVTARAQGLREGRKQAAKHRGEHQKQCTELSKRIDKTQSSLFRKRFTQARNRKQAQRSAVSEDAKLLKGKAVEDAQTPDHLVMICRQLRDKLGVSDQQLKAAGVDLPMLDIVGKPEGAPEEEDMD
tara:strand:+ start:282 stop:2117 length:1836 start_codon:yes stop_codon:yes gene_type:complete